MLIAISVFFIALVFSMFGMGGGLFYMPLFLLFFDSFQEASALSFLCILVTSFSAMIAYQQKKLIDWKLIGYLGIPLAASIFITGFLLKCAPVDFLKIIFGVTLLFAGILMSLSFNNHSHLNKRYTTFQKLDASKQYSVSPLIVSPLTFVIGLFAGMAGVAGGVFDIPLMVGILKVSAHVAVATSSAIVVMASLSGWIGRFVSHSVAFNINAEFLITLLCAFLGAQIGPRISLKVNKVIFKKICGIFIVLVGMLYLYKGFL